MCKSHRYTTNIDDVSCDVIRHRRKINRKGLSYGSNEGREMIGLVLFLLTGTNTKNVRQTLD